MTNLFETESKTIPITKEMVKEAYRKVNSNKGSAGVDEESLKQYQTDLSKNLYKLWNRMSSGSYFPQPILEVVIPKANGGNRKLGIPTVNDRIAQEVVRAYIEPRLEAVFHENSYGYRPGKNAHQAIELVEKNTWQLGWVIDMDIKSFFDEVSHELLFKAIDRHVSEKWVKMYILRWLNSPIKRGEKLIHKESIGTPQGGVISPLLANLFLHYVLDKWMEKKYPNVSFVRYADDIIIHCKSEWESQEILNAIRNRLAECKLRLNEEKTEIVYCQTAYRPKRKDYSKKFDFLGFTFKPRTARSKRGNLFLSFGFAISQKSRMRITKSWKGSKFDRHSSATIQDIANMLNPQIRGIVRYYGHFKVWTLRKLFWRLEFRLVKWARNKFKSLKRSQIKSYKWIEEVRDSYPTMFYHWTIFN